MDRHDVDLSVIRMLYMSGTGLRCITHRGLTSLECAGTKHGVLQRTLATCRRSRASLDPTELGVVLSVEMRTSQRNTVLPLRRRRATSHSGWTPGTRTRACSTSGRFCFS